MPSNEIEARIAETLEASKSPFNVCPKECKEDIRWLCETLRSSRLEVERKDEALRKIAHAHEECCLLVTGEAKACTCLAGIAQAALSPTP